MFSTVAVLIWKVCNFDRLSVAFHMPRISDTFPAPQDCSDVAEQNILYLSLFLVRIAQELY